MRILRGGSAQTPSGKWIKFDVELDESDIQRLLIEHNIENATPTVRELFALLEAEAETLVSLKMEQFGVSGEISAKQHAARVTKLLNKISDNYYGGIGDNEI